MIRQRNFYVNSNLEPVRAVNLYKSKRYSTNIHSPLTVADKYISWIFAKCVIHQYLYNRIHSCSMNPKSQEKVRWMGGCSWKDKKKKFDLDGPRWLRPLLARYSQGITKFFFVENKEEIQFWCGQHFLTMEQPLLLFWKAINILKINRKGWKTVTSILIVARGMGMDVAVRPLMHSRAFSRKDQ